MHLKNTGDEKRDFNHREWELPDFSVREFRPKKQKYCICIFVINEGQRIISQLMKMKPLNQIVDIIIADGGSNDGSLDPGFLEEIGVKTLLTKTGSGRLSAQMRMAFAYALRVGYDGVITIDGNDKDDANAIPAFCKALDDGYDHVQGSRYRKGGIHRNTPLLRSIGVRFVHSPLISLAARFHYTDTTNGFRAYSKRFLTDERVATFRHIFADYELHYYLAIRSSRLGFRVAEIPVTRVYPDHGVLPTKIAPFKGDWIILRTLINAFLGQYNP